MKNNIPPLNLAALDGDDPSPLSTVAGKISSIGVVLGPIAKFLLYLPAGYSIFYSYRMTLWWASEMYGSCGTERLIISRSVLFTVPVIVSSSSLLYLACRLWSPTDRMPGLLWAIAVSVSLYTFSFISGLSSMIASVLRLMGAA